MIGSISASNRSNFWLGKRVLLTGNTGFKGTWASLWLKRLGAEVTGFALAPATAPSFWNLAKNSISSVTADIRDYVALQQVIKDTRPQIILHMAAQALVRESYNDPLGTYSSNVMGTANLLQAARDASDVMAILVITSDKVYANENLSRLFEEGDRLGGHDPYSNSKACTELVTQAFRDSYYRGGIPVATARAGNVIGGGDWSADRLIPDCVRALASNKPVQLRYPQATRPWQHVIEAVAGYLAFVEALVGRPTQTPLALNFGPNPHSISPVRQVVETFSSQFDGKPGWELAPGQHPAEAKTLALSSELAIRSLGWRPRMEVNQALDWTAHWYRAFADGADMVAYSLEQISAYETLTGLDMATQEQGSEVNL